jgi:amino acid adenylation domain-containing protein
MKKLDKKNIEDIFILTPMQQGMLFHYLEAPKSDQYFEQLSLEITGEIDLDFFEKTWNFVAETNEMLRVVFRWEKIENPIQIVLHQHEMRVNNHVYDFSGKNEAEKEKLKNEIKIEDRKNIFNLWDVPFRVTLCKFNVHPPQYMILISQHHILYDGWSTGIILREFLEAYHNLVNGRPLIKKEKTKFREFVKWIQKQDKTQQEMYWQDYLKGFHHRTPLPIKEKPGNATITGEVRRYRYQFPGVFSIEVSSFVKERGITLATLLYTAWGVLLQKYTNNYDVIFGTTVSGRNVRVNNVENIVGLFINTVPLRVQRETRTTVLNLLVDIHHSLQVREAYETTSLVDIKKASQVEGKESLFDTILVIENYPLDQALTETDHHLPFSIESYFMYYMTNYDLTVAIETFKDIAVTFTYREELFDHFAIKRLMEHLQMVLKAVVRGAAKTVKEIDILTTSERQQLLEEFNRTYREYPIDKTINQFFEEQAARTPDNISVVKEGSAITYRELNEKSNRLAYFLGTGGVTVGTIVGIMVQPSIDMVMSLLAILKAGGAYLPIEPGLPTGRVLYMLRDAGADVLVSHSRSIGEIPFTALRGFESRCDFDITVTAPRGHIKDFDGLPRPDRSLIDLRNYRGKIGMASVTNCISLQTTRGCPYECLYCHKIWSKKHVHRSAENIYDEIEYYYRNGVRNFAVIDDCFNLHRENSSRLFQLIVKNKLKLQMFFPNGLRGDIMTPDYIDLMADAGTRGINLSLETASPRLQKLLKKNLDLDKFKNVVDYIAIQHPEIMLEMASMHGFPTETEEEALMTLHFIKDIRWLHFPYIHILKIFPNTEMETFALDQGISKQAILASRNRAFHELPETLPFPKSFTRKYQSSFMNEYFLDKERLKKVLPVQVEVLSESALAQKYDAYLPVDIKCLADIVSFARLADFELPAQSSSGSSIDIKDHTPVIFNTVPSRLEPKPGALRILLLDLSQHFSSQQMLYKVAEQPLGLIYLLTYLMQRFGDQIHGQVYKSGNDFDSFEELRALVMEYNPHLIGIRTLTYFKEFFHETTALLRQWGVDVPIFTGGPYASSDFNTILRDSSVDLVVFGEGEEILGELIREMLARDFRLPEPEVLQNIKGIAYPANRGSEVKERSVIVLDWLKEHINAREVSNPPSDTFGSDLAYVMYTSGSTGKPKGVMVEHRQVNNCIHWMQEQFSLTAENTVLQRTNLGFDPSVWELFWPLYIGGRVQLAALQQRRDVQYLIRLLAENKDDRLTVMYAPATLVTAMVNVLESGSEKSILRLPWFIIGAEPIRMDTVKSLYNYLQGQVVNTYGPTEGTVNNTYYTLYADDPRGIVPIGRPIANNQIYILSPDKQSMPVGIPGEICIAGDSTARGYINNTVKTCEAFIDNPFGSGRLYKTGDMGRWLEDGNIEIMGRIDDQVKIRGYRIEPGEIANTLSNHPDVDSCVVVMRDNNDAKKESRQCRICGITNRYPNITIAEDGTCSICRDFNNYKPVLDRYFKTLAHLEQTIREASQYKKGKYDCLMVYNGGRGAAYALYHLVDMGCNVLAISYDNGYFGRIDFKNVKKITDNLGVDHIILTHKNTDFILRESLNTAHTVCRGCFLTASSLAGSYALEHGIPIVVNATFSRGQIIDNKLFMFLRQGITEVKELEHQIADFTRSAPDMEKSIFDFIDIENVSNKTLYDEVMFLDFYRYCEVNNREMIAYLEQRDPYWKKRRKYSIYSTNCPIKQIGDFAHLEDRNFHFYGSATSWEKRLGHLTRENVKEDLTCKVTPKGFENFAKHIDYKKTRSVELSAKYLCAYYVSRNTPAVSLLKEYLSERMPDYMVPAHFIQLDRIPLTLIGKVDKKSLPEPQMDRARTSVTYVEPKTGLEAEIARIWREVLNLDKVGANDNFFDLGGNSLNIIQVSSKLKELVKQDVPVVTLFTYPTIHILAENLRREENSFPADDHKASRYEERERGKNRLKQRTRKILDRVI